MNDIEEIIQAIYIGFVVATFLYMTGRAWKAIELCKESLVLQTKKAMEKEEQLDKLVCEAIYKVMFAAYLLILPIECECGETANEGKLCIELAAVYQAPNKYVEAKELYERAISIMKKTGNKKEGSWSLRKARSYPVFSW